MKKSYVKPHMEAVSYTANSSLCGSCVASIKNPKIQEEVFPLLKWFYDEHVYDRLLVYSQSCDLDFYELAQTTYFVCKFYGAISDFFIS